MFDLILSIDTLAKFGRILDFQDKMIQIDHAKIAVRPLSSLGVKFNMCIKALQTDNMCVPPGTCTSTTRFARDHLEPISTREATKRMIEILDTDYKKANLPKIVKTLANACPQ